MPVACPKATQREEQDRDAVVSRPPAPIAAAAPYGGADTLLGLQQTVGNRAVARFLMRQPAAGPETANTHASKPQGFKAPYAHTFEEDPPVEIPPIFEFEGMKVGGELEFEPEAGGAEPEAGAHSGTTVTGVAGASSKGHRGGLNLGGEAKQESVLDPVADGWFKGVKPKFDRGISFTGRDGLEAGCGVELEGELHSFAVHFKIVEWEPGSKPKFGVVEPEWKDVLVKMPSVEVPHLGKGTIKFAGKVALVIGPDIAKLVDELVERFGKELVVDAAFDVGIALVGVATVGATVWEILYAAEEGRNEMNATLRARDDIVAYSSAYAAAIKGLEPKGGGKAAEEGAKAAKASLEKGAKGARPEALVAESMVAAGGDVRMLVYPTFRAEVRKKLVADWNREHRVKSALYSMVLMGDIDGGPLGHYFDMLIPDGRLPE